jgi:hypothetical protein
MASIKIGAYHEFIKPMYVLPLSPRFDVILGIDWLERHNPTIDWCEKKFAFNHQGHPLTLQAEYDYSSSPDGLLSPIQMARHYQDGEVIYLAVLRATDAPGVDPSAQYQAQVEELLREFTDVFPENLPNSLPPDRGHLHRIELEPGHTPPSKPTYRLSFAEQTELKKQLLDLLEKGFIQPSKSPFGAPILFVKKKDGTLRLCIDYRALNRITIKNKCPLPRIDDLLDRLQGAKYFSCLDLRSGYHQVLVHPDDIEKTAFRSRYGHFEFKVLPFGLCNAPATFQTLMNDVFRREADDFVLIYLDDIMIFSNTAEEHLAHIRVVLQRLRDHKLYAAPKKCKFFQTRIEWLGHIVSNQGIEVDPRKTDSVNEWPTPKTVLQVMSFLGLASYYRRFIQDFSQVAAPLTNLTRKDRTFVWGEAEESSFQTLKTLLTKTPVLVLASPDFPFTLHTDASVDAIGGVLMQDQGDGLRPVSYFSRKLSAAERNYPTHEQEMLALIYALKQFRHYLMGAPRSVAYTDHYGLKYLQTQSNLNARQTRWMGLLQEFDLHIDYLPGKSNVVADALSRRPAAAVPAAAAPAVAASAAADHTCLSIITTRSDPDWLTTIKTSYGADPESKTILETIHAGASTAYEIKHGLILVKIKGSSPRLFIPNAGTLRQDLLFEHHDSCLAGHLGMDKTVDYLARNYWWPSLPTDVRDYVRTCPECITSKSASRKPAGLLQPLPIPSKKFEHVTMDFVSHLGDTSSGNNTILVFVCKLTKALRLAATNLEVTAPIAARIYYDQIVRFHGFPSVIISDRDPRFTSSFWRSLHGFADTKLRLSTAFHPQTDGQSERAVRTIIDMLRCYTADETEWDQKITAIEFAYNNSVNPSTGYSPNFLLFGEHPRTHATLTMEQLQDSSANDAATAFIAGNQAAIAKAKQHLLIAQERQTRYANKKRRDFQYQVGDQVLLSTANLSLQTSAVRKLSAKWIGPFKIIQRISSTAYRLEMPAKYRMHKVFHVSLLKPYLQSTRFPARRPLRPPPLADQGDDVFLVERLLERRVRKLGRNTVIEYLVLWQGYPSYEATWESAAQLKNAGTAVQQMMRALSPTPDTQTPTSPSRRATRSSKNK